MGRILIVISKIMDALLKTPACKFVFSSKNGKIKFVSAQGSIP